MATDPRRIPQRLTCCECHHLYYDSGAADYSDLTPGAPVDLCCMRYHWALGDDDLPEALFQAETCEDFERPEKTTKTGGLTHG